MHASALLPRRPKPLRPRVAAASIGLVIVAAAVVVTLIQCLHHHHHHHHHRGIIVTDNVQNATPRRNSALSSLGGQGDDATVASSSLFPGDGDGGGGRHRGTCRHLLQAGGERIGRRRPRPLLVLRRALCALARPFPIIIIIVIIAVVVVRRPRHLFPPLTNPPLVPPSEQQQHRTLRVLLVVTSLVEYDRGTRGTTLGRDRLGEVLLPQIVASVESMTSRGWHADVYERNIAKRS